MIEWLPWLPSKSCYTNLKFFETLKDTPNPSKGFRFVAFLVLEILGGPFRNFGAQRVKFSAKTRVSQESSKFVGRLHKQKSFSAFGGILDVECETYIEGNGWCSGR